MQEQSDRKRECDNKEQRNFYQQELLNAPLVIIKDIKEYSGIGNVISWVRPHGNCHITV